jgi:hypothetical protein
MTDIEAKAAEIATQFGMWPDGSFAEIIATALREVRSQALEDAARVADRLADTDSMDATRIAPAIRALKGEQT